MSSTRMCWGHPAAVAWQKKLSGGVKEKVDFTLSDVV